MPGRDARCRRAAPALTSPATGQGRRHARARRTGPGAGWGGAAVADRDEDDAGLLERLATARKLLQRAVAEGDVEPGIAAAACAELAGEYAAAFSVERGLAPGPVLDEVARLMRRRGAAVHHALAPDAPVGSGRDRAVSSSGTENLHEGRRVPVASRQTGVWWRAAAARRHRHHSGPRFASTRPETYGRQTSLALSCCDGGRWRDADRVHARVDGRPEPRPPA
jgi:hypothetical protein